MIQISKKYRFFFVCSLVAAFLVVNCYEKAIAGPYALSSHGTSASRSSMAALSYAVGNCAHCHEQHASIGGIEPDPSGGTSPDPYLGFDIEQDLCYRCHGNGGEGGDTTHNIETEYGLGFNHGTITTNNLHRVGEKISTDFSTNRHAECMDCHDPHIATAIDTTNNAKGPTIGATGITPTNPITAPYGAMVAPNTYSEANATTSRLEQFKICFKCHSSWAGFGTGTNQALEFNTNNMGFHNVEGVANPPSSDTFGNFNIGTSTISDAKNDNWTLSNLAYEMMPRYNTYTNLQLRNVTMLCSDCHGSNGSPEGIHGSPRASLLKVPVGSPFTEWDETIYIKSLADGGVDDATNTPRDYCWCFNCHDPSHTNSGFSGADGELHVNKHSRTSARCMSCHVAIPHGYNALPRLLKLQNTLTASVYNGTASNSGIGQDSSCFQGSGNYTEGQAGCGTSMTHKACN